MSVLRKNDIESAEAEADRLPRRSRPDPRDSVPQRTEVAVT